MSIKIDGDKSSPPATSSSGVVVNSICDGRLTLESGVPISTSDQTAKTNIYFTPFHGNRVALYDGANWVMETFSELTLALGTIVDATNYDVFLDYNGGTLQLVLGTAWTNDTTRAVALVLQDGVYVLTGNTDHRYLGTFRTTATTTTEDSLAKRFVWNNQNRVPRRMQAALETTNTWTYTTATWRQANANSANQLEFIIGLDEDIINAQLVAGSFSSTTGVGMSNGIGLDSTSSPSNTSIPMTTGSGDIHTRTVDYRGNPGIGYHFLAWLENSGASGTSTWQGDNNLPTRQQSGLTGTLIG